MLKTSSLSCLIPPSTWTTPVVPPPINLHAKKIQQLIKKLRTPRSVQSWINTLLYNPRDTMRSLHQTQHHYEAHCLEAAVAAATILEYHGRPPLILDLQSADLLDHTLLLYQHRGRFGTIGLSRDIGLGGRKPVYKTLYTLVHSYAAPYIDQKAKIIGYGVLDLRTLPRQDWRTSTKNLWWLEPALENVPHRALQSSPAFIRYWRKRYLAFKKLHPHQQPDYYPQQQYWS